jgi:uncharacterized protein YdaU (DUF1376 family)
MPLYIGDELAHTQPLTTTEIGAYFLLTLSFWQKGLLPDDEKRLAQIAKLSAKEWRLVREALAPLFDDWACTRLNDKRAKAEHTHLKKSEAGRRGGRSKSNSRAAGAGGEAQPKLSMSSHNHSHNQSMAVKDRGAAFGSLAQNVRQDTFPAITGEREARRWLIERDVFPGDLDELTRKLMRGALRRDELS